MKRIPLEASAAIALLLLLAGPMTAQFTVTGQYVVRGEHRHGYGQPISDTSQSAEFIGHRARIEAKYAIERLTLFTSIQDVRTWGSTPQLNTTDGLLSCHEAWAEVGLTDSLTLKLGRMELAYGDWRFFGNVDWALQARSHDMILFKFNSDQNKIHVGAAYNANAESVTGQSFATASQYKAGLFFRAQHIDELLEAAVIYWGNGMEVVQANPDASVSRTIHFGHTVGLSRLQLKLGPFTPYVFAYYQFGVNKSLQPISAYDVSIQCKWAQPLEGTSNVSATLGAEILSGNATSTKGEQLAYDPLFGTNHAHNGYMDYFYVGGRHINSVGLVDLFLRTRYAFSSKLFVQADIHEFQSQAAFTTGAASEQRERLGTEIDLTLGFRIIDAVSVQAGYSTFLSTDAFYALRGVSSPADRQDWLYVMLIVRPFGGSPFIGLLQ